MTRTNDPFAGRSQELTAYFSDVVELYARYRPDYPDAAIDSILEDLPATARIADVGCGTGIFSRLLARRGFRIIGIEPDATMLDAARQAPDHDPSRIEYRRATAEATGLDDAAVDVITCAQAFHWFDAPAALREFHRILRPGGRLALIWNKPDNRDAFSAGYRAIMNRAGDIASEAGRTLRRNRVRDPSQDGWFTDVRTDHFEHAQSLDRDGLIGRATSASYFPAAGPHREQLLCELDEIFTAHATGGRAKLRYLTELVRARRADHS